MSDPDKNIACLSTPVWSIRNSSCHILTSTENNSHFLAILQTTAFLSSKAFKEQTCELESVKFSKLLSCPSCFKKYQREKTDSRSQHCSPPPLPLTFSAISTLSCFCSCHPFLLAFIAVSSKTDLRPHGLTWDQETSNSLSLFVSFSSARLAVSSTSLRFLPFFPLSCFASLWGPPLSSSYFIMRPPKKKQRGHYEASTPTHLC